MNAHRWTWKTEVITFALLALTIIGVATAVFSRIHYGWNWGSIWEYRAAFVQGLGITLVISVGALVVSALIGVLVALARLSGSRVLRFAAGAYVTLIRGTPLLVQLLIGYYLVAQALGLTNQLLIGILLLALFSGAYIAEILRGGIRSISQTQHQAALACGLTERQAFVHIIAPQALRRVLPALAGQFVSLVKDSSLLCVIGIEEFTYQARAANAATYSTLEAYLPLALGYLILTIPISILSGRLENRLKYDD